MIFQGQHKDKQRITYKDEGNGFQADALCAQKGITRSPLPYKYGYLPLPSYWGSFYGNFAHLYYPKLP